MDRVFTGAFDATINSMGTRRDWEEGAKNRLNRLGLRSATLENAVTGKKVPSTAIGLPHMLHNKDLAIGESQHWKQEAEEASAREIGPVGLLNVLLNVLNTQEQLFNNTRGTGHWQGKDKEKFFAAEKRKEELIFLFVYKIYPHLAKQLNFKNDFSLNENATNPTEVFSSRFLRPSTPSVWYRRGNPHWDSGNSNINAILAAQKQFVLNYIQDDGGQILHDNIMLRNVSKLWNPNKAKTKTDIIGKITQNFIPRHPKAEILKKEDEIKKWTDALHNSPLLRDSILEKSNEENEVLNEAIKRYKRDIQGHAGETKLGGKRRRKTRRKKGTKRKRRRKKKKSRKRRKSKRRY